MQLDTKKFYDELQFPGHYTKQSLDLHLNQVNNRHLYTIDSVLKNKQTVLDIGCGTGLITNLFAQRYPHSQFWAIDFSDAVDYAQKFAVEHQINNVNFAKQDILTYQNNQQFDVVMCQGVLHHIRDHDRAVAKIHSLVRPGGLAIVGLYHPWGKLLKKVMTLDYKNEILRKDQEQNVYETAFSYTQAQSMFQDFDLVASYPTVVLGIAHIMALINSKSGGLVTYIWQRPE